MSETSTVEEVSAPPEQVRPEWSAPELESSDGSGVLAVLASEEVCTILSGPGQNFS
jgi:hypothetical protein